MQFYLVISFFLCTFAPGKAIVLSVTINCLSDMDKLELCKVHVDNVIYKAYALVDVKGNHHGYRVMKGRNIAKGGAFFNNKRQAVMFLLKTAFNDVAQLSLEDLS